MESNRTLPARDVLQRFLDALAGDSKPSLPQSRIPLTEPWKRPDEVADFLVKLLSLLDSPRLKVVEWVEKSDEAYHVTKVGGRSIHADSSVNWRFSGRVKVEEGRVVALTTNLDLVDLFKQLGSLPPDCPVPKTKQELSTFAGLSAEESRCFEISSASGWAGVLISAEGTILEVNTHFAKLVRSTRKHLNGRPLDDFLDFREVPREGDEIVVSSATSTLTLRTVFRQCLSRFNGSGGAVFLAFLPRGRVSRAVRFLAENRVGLSREIHDGIAQDIAALRLFIASGRGGEMLGSVARRVAKETRSLVSHLEGPGRGTASLAGMLGELVERCQAENSLKVELSVQCEELVPEVCRIATFRVVQESLRNVASHSGVCSASVRVEVSGNMLFGEVADRGSGGARSKTTRFGMKGMRERCELLAGSLEICSPPGQGTTVRFRIPLGNLAEQ